MPAASISPIAGDDEKPEPLQPLGDVLNIRAQGRAAAEFPNAAEQEGRVAKILQPIIARDAIVIDINDEQMSAVDALQ